MISPVGIDIGRNPTGVSDDYEAPFAFTGRIVRVAIGAAGIWGIRATNARLQTVYEDRTIALEQIARINTLMLQNMRQVQLALESEAGKLSVTVAPVTALGPALLATIVYVTMPF